MQEIEVKAKISDVESLIAHLEKMGCVFSEPLHQKDTVYVPQEASIPVPNGVNVLRIREQEGKYTLTLKQPVTNQLDCIEKETEISKAQNMHDIIMLLGFVKASYVEKIRRKTKYNEYEICIDHVTGLGDYIEVEKFGTDGGKVQKELFGFLQTLGIEKEDQELMGYDVLLNIKKRLG